LKRSRIVLLVAIATSASWGCSSPHGATGSESALHDDAVTVGSFDFAESKVIAEVYSQALEAHGYPVVRAFDLGPREFVAPALQRGLVEFVPEYAGTATSFMSVGRTTAADDVAQSHAQLVRALEHTPLTALAAAHAQDTNAFVVKRQTADALNLVKVSDLTEHARQLSFGGPRECPSRPLCLRGLRDVYGLEFGQFLALDAGGPVTRQALQTGAADVGLLLSTDPAIDGDNLVALVDDRRLQPSENITPIVRSEVLDRWGPGFAETIDAVSAKLTTDDVRSLDGAMEADDADVANIARQWLRAHDLQ
jgi:osmoprotectant transport system substrate-binding protein